MSEQQSWQERMLERIREIQELNDSKKKLEPVDFNRYSNHLIRPRQYGKSHAVKTWIDEYGGLPKQTPYDLSQIDSILNPGISLASTDLQKAVDTLTGNKEEAKKEVSNTAFRMGDRVELRQDAEEYGIVDDADYLGAHGIIAAINTKPDPGFHDWFVKFDDGHQEGFKSGQLRLLSERTEEKPMSSTGDATTINGTLYRVGDHIRISQHDCENIDFDTEVAVVTRLEDNHLWFEGLESGDQCYGHNSYLQLVKRGDNTMSNVQSNPLQALKEQGLDADTRLLREFGFEEPDGTPKSAAIQEMQRRGWADVRAEVAADLRAAMAQEKADKAVNEGTAPAKAAK